MLITVLFLFSAQMAEGQVPADDPLAVEHFGFINYDTNYIFCPGNPEVLKSFFTRLDTLLFYGKGQTSILHIGGSHIQTDVYSHQMRSRLHHLQPGVNGGRGLIFPVSITGSNNPRNFSVSYTGKWQNCRNTQRNRTCNIGLTGMMLATSDSTATITFQNRDQNELYQTTIIRVFHYDASDNYRVQLQQEDPYLIRSIEYFPEGYTEIRLNAPVESFTLEVYKSGSNPALFEFFGIELINEDPGIVYHSVGVNGASIPSFLRCNLLKDHLAVIHPDLVILSLGTNDAFSKKFDPEVYKRNYIMLIELIRTINPDADILLTVPNDVFFNRKRVNHNTTLQEEVILQLAETYQCGVWNFFQVMGGINSVPVWYKNGLMQKDRVHFTPRGYVLKGDLLFSAMMKSYGIHLENKQ
jgi:hypothetical protein